MSEEVLVNGVKVPIERVEFKCSCGAWRPAVEAFSLLDRELRFAALDGEGAE